MFQSLILVSTGAAIGASLRWGLGLWLNSLFSTLAFGTLVANFIGCFLMGILVAAFWLFPQFSPEWRLFLVTGFLGFSVSEEFAAEDAQEEMDCSF